MKNSSHRYTKLACAVVIGTVISHGQLALAGWTGAMNGTGYGQASVNVRAADTSLLKKKTVSSINMQDPNAAIYDPGYTYWGLLPADASPATVAKVKGFTGYVWQAITEGSDGDSTDNHELENRVKITAADCASLEMESSHTPQDDKSGIITVNAKATAGAALWLRGYEYLGDPSTLPENPTPVYDAEGNDITPYSDFFKEFLRTNENSSLKWDVLLVGPFNLTEANCSAIKIPYTIETDRSHLYFITDGVAKSLPLLVFCPTDKEVKCNEQPVVYEVPGDEVKYAGCGDITYVFDPPQGTVFPVGNNPVTVTATDEDGNQKSCTFNVTVTDAEPPVITATGTPDDGALGLNPTEAQIEAALGTAEATDNCGVGTPTATTGSVIVDGCSSSQTRTWNVSDAAGNPATPVSRTVTWYTGLSIKGFYAPIGTQGNECETTTVFATKGNNIPIKFDMLCGTSYITTGPAPTVTIQESDPSCDPTGISLTVAAEYQNDWHINWDTSPTKKNHKYRISVSLNQVELGYVWVRIK